MPLRRHRSLTVAARIRAARVSERFPGSNKSCGQGTSPVYAAAGSLAIISLKQSAVTYVPSVEDVYVIVNGPHRGEILYQQRMDEHGVHYRFVHARADGKPIKVLAEEYLYEGLDKVPRLEAYLRSIGGQIMVNGHAFPK